MIQQEEEKLAKEIAKAENELEGKKAADRRIQIGEPVGKILEKGVSSINTRSIVRKLACFE